MFKTKDVLNIQIWPEHYFCTLHLMAALVFNMRKILNSKFSSFLYFYKKNLFDNLKCNLANLVNSVEYVDTMDVIF